MFNGLRLPAGDSFSTIIPDMDYETYSEAGYYFDKDAARPRWRTTKDKAKHGLECVGARVYAEHPTTDVLCLKYDLKDGKGPRIWIPLMQPPFELFEYLAKGGLIEAHNCLFEYYIWTYVCVRKYGWPPLNFWQLRDSMAKCRAFGVPGALMDSGKALKVSTLKQKEGKALLKKFSQPRTPTKKDLRMRIRPIDDPTDAEKLYDYCEGDIITESQVSTKCPDLLDREQNLWLLDQLINIRGVHIDAKALSDCIAIVNQATRVYTAELSAITGGAVNSVNEIQEMRAFLHECGVFIPDIKKDTVELWVDNEENWTEPESKVALRVLKIRQLIGSAGIKKLYTIDRCLSASGRLHDLFAYCGAERTGRWAGRGAQPQNLPKAGPKIQHCDPIHGCGRHYGRNLQECPWCKTPDMAAEWCKWNPDAILEALEVIATRDLRTVEHYYGDAITTVTGCLRALFTSTPGKDMICADYNAIEAIVLAQLAGEEWRLEVFRTHGKIYEMSAAKITGVPFEEMMRHAGYHDLTLPNWWEAKQTGEHHPDRQKIGKVAELASGYQGWLGAWMNFGADKFLDEDKIIESVKAWRQASPNIVKFWYACERAAKNAIKNPGHVFKYRYVSYHVTDDVLYCTLPSGRKLSYHEPRIGTAIKYGKTVEQITFMGFNSDTKKGPRGWMRLNTYGGSLVENITQAVARDIMAHAMPSVEKAGYQIILHVHDELATEVPTGTGSVAELESMMTTLPAWAHDWPIRAVGGWRDKRYKKD